jgi:hypothetical protein
MKPKKCKSCRAEFIPSRPLQSACGVPCAIALTNAGKEKSRKAKEAKERAEHRQAKEKVKSKGEHAKEAQAVFNSWIRLRDHGLPCISCGTTANVQYAAGHYRTVASCPELRFEPLNVHLQCNRNCNMAKSGSILEYRIELVRRIGQEKVDWLEGPHEPKRYTIEDLKAIKAHYRAKVRELKALLATATPDQ